MKDSIDVIWRELATVPKLEEGSLVITPCAGLNVSLQGSDGAYCGVGITVQRYLPGCC